MLNIVIFREIKRAKTQEGRSPFFKEVKKVRALEGWRV